VHHVEDLDHLVNVDYGRWEGMTKEEAEEDDAQEWSLYLHDPERCTCPDGESLSLAADRIVEGLRVIAARHPGQSVAAVSHGVMLRLAVLRTAGVITGDWQFKMPTGGALVFEVENDEISFVGTTWESELGAPALAH
jgi:broad specificity phosphatase PhoE